MSNDLRDRMLTCRFVLILRSALAAVNGTFGVVRLVMGEWGYAVMHLATVAFIATLSRWCLLPTYRQLKVALRDARIAEMEEGLGIR